MLEDFRFAVRGLARRPLLTMVGVLTLALGIGAVTAIFAVVDAVLLRPLPHPEPERLVMVWETMRDWNDRWVAPANFLDWQAEARSFEALAAFDTSLVNLSDSVSPPFSPEGDSGASDVSSVPERLPAQTVSPSFFKVLRAEPILGRVFRLGVDDHEAGKAPRIVVLSHGLWQSRYGGTPDVLGRTLEIDGESHEVVGVMGMDFRFYPEGDQGGKTLWILGDAGTGTRLSIPGVDVAALRDSHLLSVVGRLAPGVSLEEARGEMTMIAARLADEYPETNHGLGANVIGLDEEVRGDVRPKLLILLAAVALLNLVAAANVAHLILVRGQERRSELELRVALGASRARLARLLLSESLVLAVLGGLAGLVTARLLTGLFLAVAPEGLPGVEGVVLDGRIVAFNVLVALATGLFFGLLPALKASAAGAAGQGVKSTSSRQRRRGRDLLMAGELAAAQVLLVAAGLLALSFERLVTVDPGFESDGLLTFELSLSSERYRDGERKEAFYGAVLERLSALPGARSAAAMSRLPLDGNANRGWLIEGRPEPAPGEDHTVDFQIVSPAVFATLGTPILRGRHLTMDDGVDQPPVVVINEAAARHYWPGENPVGQRVRYRDQDPWSTVVGIVRDIRHRGLAEEPRPTVYVSYRQNREPWWNDMAFAVRTEVPPETLAGAARAAVHTVDAWQPVSRLSTMPWRMRETLASQRFLLLLIGGFAAAALVLAVIGIAGVVGYSTAQRAREMAIRTAVGARRGQVVRLILGESAAVGGAGIVVGLGLAAVMTRFLEAELFRIAALEPRIFVGVAALLFAAAMGSAYLPARRAAGRNPLALLRQD